MDDATTFAYDWRRDNNESTDRFIRYLEQIKQCHGGRAPQVIAHSNGGKPTRRITSVLPLPQITFEIMSGNNQFVWWQGLLAWRH